jgi:methylated-DNA-protein-cysteine methyltransferase-like protein
MTGPKNKKNVQQNLSAVKPSGKREGSFFESVYDVARQIPRGRVTSYGAIAACLGTRLSARMVGWAMNGAGRIRPKVPAHRVVNRNGMLSGKHHFATQTTMQELLEKEGIKIKNDAVVGFEKLFWDPAKVLF